MAEPAVKPDWQAVVARKRAERQSRLPARWLIPQRELSQASSDKELRITGLDMVALAAAIRERKYTSVEVVEAFAHRATIAQQLVNALTEINFTAAMEEAAELDRHIEETGKVVGPLHGVPISVKDTWHVEGLDSTMGYCAWAGRIAKKDSLLVEALRKAGAIVIAQTNVGLTLMVGETVNNLWGRTLNPYNRSLTTGGSSGGETALLAMRGAAIGMGTDIGGSVRKPANMCGLWSLRPSAGRISLKDISDSLLGQEAVKNVGGPMGHSAHDINLFLSSYMAYKPWEHDPNVLVMPWDGKLVASWQERRLTFAIAWGDEQVTPHPPILRGLHHVVAALKAAGHIVIDWQGPIGIKETREIMGEFWAADGGEELMTQINASGEPMYSEVEEAMHMQNGQISPLSVNKTWQNQTRRTRHAQWFFDVWKATALYSGTGRPIDGFISPTQPSVAAPHQVNVEGIEKPGFYDYAWLEPLLDISSGTFPSGLHQDPMIDLPAKDFKPRSELDAKIQAQYHDPQDWANGPIGFQVIARRLEEEKVVGMLLAIDQALVKQRAADKS